MYKNLVTDVFFDLDHTLWDFEKNSALTFQKILKEQGVRVSVPDFLAIYVPANQKFWKLYREEKITKEELRYVRLRTVFNRMGLKISDETIQSLSEAYIENLSTFGHLIPHANEILDYLRPHYNLHIITNGFKEIQEKKLRNSGIHHYFEHIINSETIGVKKPNPLVFQKALKNANTLPEKSVMIGDSLEADILGAKAVGLYTIHFNVNQEAGHDYGPIITDLSEIKRLL